MALYEVTSNNTFVLSKPSFFSNYIGTLNKGTQIDVKSISNGWANLIFQGQNGYVRSSNLKLVQVVTGSITINYIDSQTSQSLATPLTNSGLTLGTYSYNSISISGYTALDPKTQSITLTSANANQSITFKYKKIVGSVTIKYIDNDTLAEIASASIVSNLNPVTYTYNAPSISGYTVVEPASQSVTLTEANPNQTVTFKYKKIVGSVTVKYIDVSTNTEIAPSKIDSNLNLGSYTYTAINIDGYNLSGDSSKTITLTESAPNITITFNYNKIVGSVTIKYVDETSLKDIATSTVINNLSLGSYSYNAITIANYTAIAPTTQSVTLTSTQPNQTVTFKYRQILGSVTIKYVDETTLADISTSTVISNLSLGTYSYNSIAVNGYTAIDPKTLSVTLTAVSPNQTITFKYSQILGSVTIKYIDESTLSEISTTKNVANLSLGSYTYDAITIDGYDLVSTTPQSVTLSADNLNQTITFKYKKQAASDLYVIELSKFNIFNNNTEAVKTTKGINDALIYAKQQGYKKIQLPAGNYLIENTNTQMTKKIIDILDSTKSWSFDVRGILIPDNIVFIAENCTFNMEPNKLAGQGVINFADSHNSQFIGGTIIGDRDTHLFELVINRNANQLESGDFDLNTGLPIEDSTKVRTISYISSIDDGSALPTSFVICPLTNTSMNTVDGGCRYIYCYDKDNNYLGKATGDNSFLTRATLPANTAKIKVSFRGEKRLDAKYYLTTEKTYITFEQCYGIRIFSGNNITIQNVTSNNFLSDGAATMGIPINHTINNLNILGCTFENNRRQGMSFVGTTDGCLLKDCKFGKTQGVDPQCGIDFEHYTYVKNVVVDSCDFYDNKKWDIINYNGWDIEIKNSRFNGAIASTYGYNMNINNNTFKYSDSQWLDKSYKGTLFSLNTNKTDADGAYYKINYNSIDGYNNAGSTSLLSNSIFVGNILNNTSIKIGANASNNIYNNCSVRYVLCDYVYTKENLNNCNLLGEDNGSSNKYRYYNNFTLNNCNFYGGILSVLDTVLSNCIIYSDNKSFSTQTGGNYTIKDSTITTKYTSNIPFISNHGRTGNYINCNLNVSCTPFITLNYGSFNMNNCTVTFNNFYNSQESISFYRNVYGSAIFDSNKFYKDFTYPKVILPTSTNSSSNNIAFTNSITI